jgi:hypothetical protein
MIGELNPHTIWNAFQMAIRKSSFTSSLKVVHHICPTQVYKVKLNNIIYSKCPCCILPKIFIMNLPEKRTVV